MTASEQVETRGESSELDSSEAQSEHLDHLAEISRNGQRIFLALLAACFYSLLAVGTTSDAAILSNATSLKLPIIGVDLPILWFYFSAPVLLLLIFVYFHFCLEPLWRGLALLPIIREDGRPIDDYVFPWLITSGVLGATIPELRAAQQPIMSLRSAVCLFLAYGFVPVTLIFFWGRYATRHDWYGTAAHIGLISLAVATGAFFYRLAVHELLGRDRASGCDRWWKRGHLYVTALVAFVVSGAVFGALSYGAVMGAPAKHCERVREHADCSVLHFGAKVFELVGASSFADLDGVDVSGKPASWTGQGETLDEVFAPITAANLVGTNLRYAAITQAFLVKAELERVELGWADLSGADLRRANLKDAGLENAKLAETRLEQANLEGAKLDKADLYRARLQGAKLDKADLVDCFMMDVDLTEATGVEADFTRADMRFARLDKADLSSAKFHETNLKEARGLHVRLNDADLTKADLKFSELVGALMRRAKLEEANIEAVNWREADLRDANLQRAKLWEADLTKIIGTDANLDEAVLESARLNGADLRFATFLGADLKSARLNGADLRFATFLGADLSNSYLKDAKLDKADFTKAILTGIIASGAKFGAAKLDGAKLDRAVLRGADLSAVTGLTQSQLDQSCGDKDTKLPEPLRVPPCYR